MQSLKSSLLLIGILLVTASCRFGANLHILDPGKAYRSAQLTPEELQQLIDNAGIKTVINLRGASENQKWYQDEVEVTRRNGVLQIDIPMSASIIPHRENLLKLLDSFANAPRPLLIHCLQGADRTGEASVIYQMEYMGKSRKEALKMLNPKYMHFKFAFPAKDYFMEEVWQGSDWAYNNYHPCDPNSTYKYYNKNSEYCKGKDEAPLSANDDT